MYGGISSDTVFPTPKPAKNMARSPSQTSIDPRVATWTQWVPRRPRHPKDVNTRMAVRPRRNAIATPTRPAAKAVGLKTP